MARAWLRSSLFIQEGSIEALLAAEGVQEDAIDSIVTGLVAWRLTKAGRPLVDKRRQRRVRTNIPLVVDFLVNKVCLLQHLSVHLDLVLACPASTLPGRSDIALPQSTLSICC